MINPTVLARAIEEMLTHNTLAFEEVKIRFQIAGGTDAALAIADVPWELKLAGLVVLSGRTTAEGDAHFFMLPNETLTLTIFNTDYNVTLHAGVAAVTTLAGQQKRLDILGYMTGYLLDGRPGAGGTQPDDGTNGPVTQQGALNFQTDQGVLIDAIIGNNTQTALTNNAGV